MLLELLKKIARTESIGNVIDATILSKNRDGTYNIKFKGGAIKNRVVNVSNQEFGANTSVTVLLLNGKLSHARIVGRGLVATKNIKVIDI